MRAVVCRSVLNAAVRDSSSFRSDGARKQGQRQGKKSTCSCKGVAKGGSRSPSTIGDDGLFPGSGHCKPGVAEGQQACSRDYL
mmetsp:Transcript_67968/g.150707  ORF Transcript_67968/g.150707 Transcript_67968/m.150707 type:complete len:83 (-) Transcript_67968:437-685(-)